jgi:type IV secretory pathway TraG/TraD family ATPase VirD4
MALYRLGEGPYGSAYRGGIDDILAAGDLTPAVVGNRTLGLFLGQFGWSQRLRHHWKEPKPGLLAFLKGDALDRFEDEVIPQVHDFRFTGDQHHLLVAGTGAGKFRDALSNMLLYDGSCETSCLIIDPKGEIASNIGPIVDEADAEDPRTLILDPWNVCKTGFTHALTLLEGLTLDNPHCVKDARVLADAMIVHRQGDSGHWDQTAKNFLTALLLYLGTHEFEEGRRHLRRLRELVTLPWGTENDPKTRSTLGRLLEFLASQEEMFGGIVARAVQAFLNREPKERSYILSTIERDTDFVEDPSLWAAIDHSTIDINALVRSNKRLHVVVPFDYITPMRSWLRLTIAAYYNACLRNPMSAELPKYLSYRHIIIDEFPSLGQLDFMVRGIAEARGAGIKYHLAVQSFSQLKATYGDHWETFISNSLIQAFGIDDVFTCEYLSKLCGQATVVTTTESFSESSTHTDGTTTTRGSSWRPLALFFASSHNKSTATTESFSYTKGTGTSFSTTGRPVLMPDEIRRLPANEQLLFLRGMPVLMARREPYFALFRNFVARHSLSAVLRKQKQRLLPPAARQAGFTTSMVPLAPPSSDAFTEASPRAAVNSSVREGRFRAPTIRWPTLKEAMKEDVVPLSLAAALCVLILGLLAYNQIIDYLHYRALLTQQQAVVVSFQRQIDATAAEFGPATIDREWLGHAVEEALERNANVLEGLASAAISTVADPMEKAVREARQDLSAIKEQFAGRDFDDVAHRMLMDAGAEAIGKAQRRMHDQVATEARDAAREAAEQAIAGATARIQEAGRIAVAEAGRSAGEVSRKLLERAQAAEIELAARERLETVRIELLGVRDRATKEAVLRVLTESGPAMEASAKRAAETVVRAMSPGAKADMIASARLAMQTLAETPIASRSERAASAAFIRKRNEIGRGDRDRWVMLEMPERIIAALVKAPNGDLVLLWEVSGASFAKPNCFGAGFDRGGFFSYSAGQRYEHVCVITMSDWDKVYLRRPVKLIISESSSMVLPDSVRLKLQRFGQ